jgi:hypothetical protein
MPRQIAAWLVLHSAAMINHQTAITAPVFGLS